MTTRQFALAARADEKWVENTARLLGHRLKRTEAEARWYGLVHLLCESVGASLEVAARIASSALDARKNQREVRVKTDRDGAAAIVVDVDRYLSGFIASLSAARVLSTPRRRGRPARRGARSTLGALDAAKAYGVDLSLLRASFALTPAARLDRLDQNAASLRELRRGQLAARSKRPRRSSTRPSP